MLRDQLSGALTALAIAIAAPAAAGAAPVTAESLLQAQGNGAEWLLYGRDYRNTRYSPLDQLTPANAAQLKPVFAYSTGGKFAGLEATPLFHDGSLYFSGDYSRVFALDARTGTVRWYWEPKYEDGVEAVLCCGPVNRGLAILGDHVFVGTLDNFVRPMLIRRGADLPFLLILAGVLGGLLTLGIVGLFIGPVVLAIAYRLLEAWIGEGEPPKRGA